MGKLKTLVVQVMHDKGRQRSYYPLEEAANQPSRLWKTRVRGCNVRCVFTRIHCVIFSILFRGNIKLAYQVWRTEYAGRNRSGDNSTFGLAVHSYNIFSDEDKYSVVNSREYIGHEMSHKATTTNRAYLFRV